MKKLAYLMLAGLLAVAGVNQAKAQSMELWKHKWVRDAVDLLKKDTSCLDFCPTRNPTDIEIAVMTNCVYHNLLEMADRMEKSIPKDSSESSHRRLPVMLKMKLDPPLDQIDLLGKKAELLFRLANNLNQELEAITVFPKELISNIVTLQSRLDMIKRKSILSTASQVTIADIPSTHHVFYTLKCLRSDGLCPPFETHAFTTSRLELTKLLLSSYQNLLAESARIQTQIESLKSIAPEYLSRSELENHKKLLDDAESSVDLLAEWSSRRRDLDRTIDFFSAEIKALGRDPKELKRQLREAL